MKIKPFFRFYDLWIGAYIDIPNRAIYICPIPMFGLKIQLAPKPDVTQYKMIRNDDTPVLKVSELRNGTKRAIVYGTLDEWKEFNRDDPC